MRCPTAGFVAHLTPRFPSPASLLPSSQSLPPLPEYCPTSTHAHECSTFVEGVARAPIRLCFERKGDEKEIEGTEVVAAFVSVDGQELWLKVYAIGEGVKGGPHLWFVDTAFADLAIQPEQAEGKKISLRLARCTLRTGVKLGTGHLVLADTSFVDHDKPLCVFTWWYMPRAHLELFGVLSEPSPPPPPSETETALSFLHQMTHILLSLLTTEQRLLFIDELAIDIGTLELLPQRVKDELERFRAQGAAVGAAGGGVQDDSGMWEGGLEGLLLDAVGDEKDEGKKDGGGGLFDGPLTGKEDARADEVMQRVSGA
ncbi:hypothetical protein JCM6882_001458 [Rhodosporidiobolus microsporus]